MEHRMIRGLSANVIIIDELFHNDNNFDGVPKVENFRNLEMAKYKSERKQNNDWRRRNKHFQGLFETGVQYGFGFHVFMDFSLYLVGQTYNKRYFGIFNISPVGIDYLGFMPVRIFEGVMMKFKVNYSLISWASTCGKVSRTKKIVNAENAEEAKLKVLKATGNKAFNFVVQTILEE